MTGTSAFAIYSEWHDPSHPGQPVAVGDGAPLHSYVVRLCTVVTEEYRAQGFCTLVDGLIEARQPLDCLTCYALWMAETSLRGGDLPPFSPLVPQTLARWILGPRLRGRVTWKEAQDYLGATGPRDGLPMFGVKRSLELLGRLRGAGQRRHLAALAGTLVTGSEAAKGEPPAAGAGEGPASERDEGEGPARDRDQAAADDALVERVASYLRAESARLRESAESDLCDASRERAERLGAVERLHDEMCRKTDELQREWTSALATSIEGLSALKDQLRGELYRTLHTWQASLYPHEFYPLAQRYVELYQIVGSLDVAIAQEAVWDAREGAGRIGQETNTGAAMAGEGATASGERPLEPSPPLERLVRLKETLTAFLDNYEDALGSLGLYVFTPREGDAFDRARQVANQEDEPDRDVSHVVASCDVPGVARAVDGSGFDDVIIHAVVTLRDGSE